MKNSENESNEKKAKRKFDVFCEITAVLTIICAVLIIGTIIWSFCSQTIPKVMILIIAIISIACVIFNTLQNSAKNKYIEENYKGNNS